MLASNDPLGSLRRTLNKMGLPMTTSNWIGVTASQTESGHPIAVMGPQTGYYNPQLLWEAAVVSHGGTPYEFAARGITTVNLPYIVIGHGLDFAWRRSEEHTSELQSLMRISYAVFCLKQKTQPM